jgi:hypothetical protein
MVKNLGAKILGPEMMHMHETVDEVRTSARKVGEAAESQAGLNIVLTAACLVAILLAAAALYARTDV